MILRRSYLGRRRNLQLINVLNCDGYHWMRRLLLAPTDEAVQQAPFPPEVLRGFFFCFGFGFCVSKTL